METKDLTKEIAKDLETLIMSGAGTTQDQLVTLFKKIKPRKKLVIPGIGYNEATDTAKT